jgi:multicomponent Na+:H+ antiporter subunit E
MNKPSFVSLLLTFVSLMLFWVIMSGFLDAIHLGFGLVTVLGVMAMNHKLKSHQFFEDDLSDFSELRFARAFFYFFWLFWQIIVSGFHVVSIIIRPSMPIRPAMLSFRADLPSSHAKAILGNSITLTPGTLTIDIEDDLFTVHALDDSTLQGIISDEMPRQVLKLFQSEERQVISDVKIIRKKDLV